MTAITDESPAKPSVAGSELASRIPQAVTLRRWSQPPLLPSQRFSPDVDGSFKSIRAIIRAAAPVLSECPGAIVLASGPTFAEFVAAYHLHTLFGSPYALDYRDEWTECPFDFVGRGLTDRLWERRCLTHATAVVFTTLSMQRHYLATFPRLQATKTVTIRNGWEDIAGSEAPPEAQHAGTDRARMTLGFFGTLGEHFGFDEFACTLAKALAMDPTLSAAVDVELFGSISSENLDAIQAHDLSPNVHFLGQLPHPLARARMTQCTALLLLNGPRVHRYIPGKTYDYIASRRPVLLYGAGGELEAILRQQPGVIITQRGDASGLAAALQNIISGAPLANLEHARQESQEYAYSLHRSHRNQEWLTLFEALLNDRSRTC